MVIRIAGGLMATLFFLSSATSATFVFDEDGDLQSRSGEYELVAVTSDGFRIDYAATIEIETIELESFAAEPAGGIDIGTAVQLLANPGMTGSLEAAETVTFSFQS